MGTKKLSTEIRREHITKEAVKMLASRGLGELHMTQLAANVGLVPSGIYRHFKSKEEIVTAVLNFAREMLWANVDAICRETPDALERLRSLLERHLRMLQDNPGIPRMVFSEVIFSDRTDAKVKVCEIITGYLIKIEGIVRLGQDSGKIRPDLNPATVAVFFLGLIIPPAILSRVIDGGFDATAHSRRVWPIAAELLQRSPEEEP